MVLVIIERIKYNIFYETLTGGICMGSYLNPGNSRASSDVFI